MKTLVIGRSQYADISIADASVARRHAELVVTDDRRYHLTDCASEQGTWRQLRTAAGEPTWEPVRQAFVGPDDVIRLGDYACTLGELLRDVLGRDGQVEPGRVPAVAGRKPTTGPVERDPLTGEIVRRRL